MSKQTIWALSRMIMGLALAQQSCAVCTCIEEAPAQLPNANILRTAESSDGSAAMKSVPYTWKNVVVLGGGFVSGIIFSPIEKDLIYARTDVGGAYRWNPDDKTWIPLNDDLPRKSDYVGVESLATDPVDPNTVYIAAGTYVQPWAGPGAILRSNDRGNTWKVTPMPIKMGGNEYGRSNGERLAIDPNQPSILFFGSRKDGLWKSTDAGVTWNVEKSFTTTDDGNSCGIAIILFDKLSGSKGKPTPILYAFVANKHDGMVRSTDGGATWKVVPKQPQGVMASHAEFDSTGNLFISYGNGPGPNDVTHGSVWKYQPKQKTFTNITPLAPTKDDKFGYGGLSVSQSQPGTLMASTIDRWTQGDEVFRTTDGGKTWKALFPKVVRDDLGAKYLYWHRPNEPMGRGWIGDIDIDPFNPSRAMYITGQGIWGTLDANAADADKPTHWTFLNRGLEETVIHGLVSPPAGPPLQSVMSDLCGFRHDDLSAPSALGMYANPICNTGTGLDIAWGKPDVLARVGWHDKQWGAYSIDGGKTWIPFKANPKGNGAGSIAVAADGSSFVWAPKGGPVVFSKDNGATWTVAEGLPKEESTPNWAPAGFRPAADRVNPEKFYVLDAKGGQAFYSTDGGAHFFASPNGLSSMADYELTSGSVTAVPGIEGDLWMTTGKGLHHSTDSGKSFTSVANIEAAHGIGLGKAAPGKPYPTLYLIGTVGQGAGFFRSLDAGVSWERINDNQHQFGFVSVITGDPRVFGRVYLGTGGRGILYGEPSTSP